MSRKQFDKEAILRKCREMSNDELFEERMFVNLDNILPGNEEFEVDSIEEELRQRLIAIGFLEASS